jgi:chromate transporter
MLLKLFLTFLKINFLTTSGPASIGLTQQLIVPDMVSKSKFSEMVAITSGIPGSDAMQMAWQTGYEVSGVLGAIVSVVGALIPTLLLVSIVVMGIKYIDAKVLSKFFSGVNPVLAVMLVMTAISLLPANKFDVVPLSILLLSVILFLFKIPLIVCLLIGGAIGALFL